MRVYTGGTFDLFHAGHVAFLKRCSEFGPVTVALNRDEFVLRFKGRLPVYPLPERITILRSCRYVDQVVVNDGDESSKQAIACVLPNVVIVGSDWATRDYHAQIGVDQQWLDQNGIGLVFIPYTSGISSTLVRERIDDRSLDANQKQA